MALCFSLLKTCLKTNSLKSEIGVRMRVMSFGKLFRTDTIVSALADTILSASYVMLKSA